MKYYKIIFFLLVFVAANAQAQKNLDALLLQHNTKSIPYISVEQLRMLQLNDTVVVFDAREIEEFKVSHIASAEYIGFNEFSLEAKVFQKLNKNSKIIVYCSLGIRSEKIGEKLKKGIHPSNYIFDFS